MITFEFATAGRIFFGAGKLNEAPAIARQFGRRALVVIDKMAQSLQRVEPLLKELLAAGVEASTFSVASEPSLEVVGAGAELAAAEKCDVVISVGGGSVMDTGKAIAALVTNGGVALDYVEVVGKGQPLVKPSLPHVAIPTTAGTGAEVTRNAVLESAEHRVKVSMRSPFLLPTVALVDPELTYSVPPTVTASTGLDALTQLIEPFMSVKSNPLTDALCREGMMRVARSLQNAVEHGNDAAAREDMALASLFGGLALANAGLGAVHGLAGPMGAMYHVPHGVLCAAFLPHVIEVNVHAASQAGDSRVVQRFTEVKRIVGDVGKLCRAVGIKSLRDFGIPRDDFPSIIEKAAGASSMKGNPVKLTNEQLREILQRAF